jgi:hypothetical protein
MEIRIIESFLHKRLLEHFDIKSFKEWGNLTTKKDSFYLYLVKKNNLPQG